MPKGIPGSTPVCKMLDCPEPNLAGGLCRKHYYRQYRHGDPNVVLRFYKTCATEDCDEQAIGHGYCRVHHARWARTGGTDLLPKPSNEERFWALVDKNGPLPHKVELGRCWLWTGGNNGVGYGTFWPGGKREKGKHTVGAHRWSYQLHNGPIPKGLIVDHLCHNGDPTCLDVKACLHRRCVNPVHLEAITHRMNLLRGNTWRWAELRGEG